MLLLASMTPTHALKTLYLVRHAKSSHDDPTLTDFDRPLAERGFKDAPKIGKRLKNRGIQLDLIMSSTSVRTKQTIEPIAKALGYDYDKILWNRKIYRCSGRTYIEQVKMIDDAFSSVMVVGHNPATTYCANFWQNDTTIEKVFTTGVVAIEFNTDSWKKISKFNGKFKFFEYPKRNP